MNCCLSGTRMLLTSANDAPVGMRARQIPKNSRLRCVSDDAFDSAIGPFISLKKGGAASAYHTARKGGAREGLSSKTTGACTERICMGPQRAVTSMERDDSIGVAGDLRHTSQVFGTHMVS